MKQYILVAGPSQAKINCSDNGDGSADVSYMPTQPGEYAVHVLCDNEDIPKSPFMAMIAPTMPSSVGNGDMVRVCRFCRSLSEALLSLIITNLRSL